MNASTHRLSSSAFMCSDGVMSRGRCSHMLWSGWCHMVYVCSHFRELGKLLLHTVTMKVFQASFVKYWKLQRDTKSWYYGNTSHKSQGNIFKLQYVCYIVSTLRISLLNDPSKNSTSKTSKRSKEKRKLLYLKICLHFMTQETLHLLNN